MNLKFTYEKEPRYEKEDLKIPWLLTVCFLICEMKVGTDEPVAPQASCFVNCYWKSIQRRCGNYVWTHVIKCDSEVGEIIIQYNP